MLTGITKRPLKRFMGERGSFADIIRSDWSDAFQDDVYQANMSISYPGVVRAWHKHERGQIDCPLAINEALKIRAYYDKTQDLDEVVSTGENLQAVKVPGNYWQGSKEKGNEPAMLVYFMNELYDYEIPDGVLRPWIDQAVAPTSINGTAGDPHCSSP